MSEEASLIDAQTQITPQTGRRLKRKAASSNLSNTFVNRTLDFESGEPLVWSGLPDTVSGTSHEVAREADHSLLPSKHSFAQVLRPPISFHRESNAFCKQTRAADMPTPTDYSQRVDKGPPFVVNQPPPQSATLVNRTVTEDISVSLWASYASPSWPLASSDSTHQTTFGSNSNASDPSISRFPLPPHDSDRAAVNSSQETRKATEQDAPIIYRTRGASFEFLNPRESLRLERIEAPTGDFTHSADYTTILRQQRAKDLHLGKVDATSTEFFDIAMDMNRAHSTPPRSLFDDLHTAYSSITSRPVQKTEGPLKTKATNDLPLTPTPVKETKKSFDHTNDSLSLQLEPVKPPWPQPTLSRKKRLSNLWHANRCNNLSLSRDCDSDPGHVQSEPMSPFETTSPAKKRLEFRRPVSEAEILRNRSEQVNENGFRNDTASRGSMLDLSDLDPASPESKIKDMIAREESTEALFSAYQYSFSDEVMVEQSRRGDAATIPQIQLQTPKDDVVPYSADSTIGDILEDYHRPDDSCTIPEEFLLDSDTRRFTYAQGDSFRTSSGISRVSHDPTEQDDSRSCQPPNSTADHKTDVRRATVEALKSSACVGPSGPLPADPTARHEEDDSRLGQGVSVEPFPSSSCLSSYGDTGNLLQGGLRIPPIEFGRGAAGSKSALQRDLFSSSESFLAPLFKSPPGNKGLTTSASFCHEDEVDSMLTREIQHLSGLSGISGLSGSIYVLRTSSDGVGDVERATIDVEAPEHENSAGKGHRTSTGANYVPQVAAFSQRSVKPGIRRLLSTESLGNDFQRDRHSDVSLSTRSSSSHFDVSIDDDADLIDDAADMDWETLPETRDTRNTFMTGSSWEDCSSIGSTNNLSAGSLLRSDPRFRAFKRIGLCQDMDDLPLSRRDSRVGSGVPYGNAIHGCGIYSYKHPSPLSPSHENPFTSSPPSLEGVDSQVPSKNLPSVQGLTCAEPTFLGNSTQKSIYQWHRPNLSVVYEAPAEASGTGTSTKTPVTNVRSDDNLSSGHDVRSYTSSAVLGSEPGPELSSEAVNGSPYDLLNNARTHRPYSLTTTDVKMVQRLRQNDPRMASSPLSDSNSFAKFATLGPRLNITGTPDGTGMREVGSSVVASSSPFAMVSSPPVVITPGTPLQSETHKSQKEQVSDSPILNGDSPLIGYDRSYARSQHNVLNDEHLRGFGPSNPCTSKRTGTRGRSAVVGQTELKSLGLAEDKNMLPVPPKRAFFQRGPYAIPFGHQSTQSALTKFNIKEFSLKERYRSPSSRNSATKSRKTVISWFTFAACALFPPMLVMYGLGYLDPGIAYLTKDEIRHFGNRPKKVAKWLGIVFTIAIIGAIIIFWIVVKSVPNNLPRK